MLLELNHDIWISHNDDCLIFVEVSKLVQLYTYIKKIYILLQKQSEYQQLLHVSLSEVSSRLTGTLTVKCTVSVLDRRLLSGNSRLSNDSQPLC